MRAKMNARLRLVLLLSVQCAHAYGLWLSYRVPIHKHIAINYNKLTILRLVLNMPTLNGNDYLSSRSRID